MENTELNAFQWDDTVPEMDFFGTTVTNPNKGVPASAEIKAPEEGEKPTKIDPDKEEPTIDFFGEINNPGDNEPGDDNGEEGQDDGDQGQAPEKSSKTKIKTEEGQEDKSIVISNSGVANFLKEKGFIDFELEEGEELDEAGAEQLIEDAFDDSVEQRLEQTIASLPDAVKNLVKFAAKGGDVDEYLASVSQTSSQGVTKNLDMTKEANQEKFMRYKLAQEGNDEEYIDFQIETMKDSGKLEALSTKSFGAWKKTQDSKDEELVTAQRERVEAAKKTALTFKRDITKHVSEVKDINGLKFSRQDARELPDYITNATEQVNGKQTTPFYKELSEALKDKDKVLVMAKLLKSNFSFKDIEKAAATKVASKVKSDIQRQQQNNIELGSTAGGGSQAKRLADYFND